jgi:hypothetical protein
MHRLSKKETYLDNTRNGGIVKNSHQEIQEGFTLQVHQ